VAKKIPMRQCVGCGEMKEKPSLIRIIKDNTGAISLDVTGRKNGRGAYVCKNKECLAKLKKKNGLDKAFQMRVDKEIYEQLEKEFADTYAE